MKKTHRSSKGPKLFARRKDKGRFDDIRKYKREHERDLKKVMKKQKFFLSFVAEFIMNPEYENYTGGRLEVYGKDDEYAREEIRFFTDRENEFRKFRDKWDFEKVGPKTLEKIRAKIKSNFYEEIE